MTGSDARYSVTGLDVQLRGFVAATHAAHRELVDWLADAPASLALERVIVDGDELDLDDDDGSG